ncbi:MAG: SIMPL domain-containing protein [Chloroflexota bacterium]
MHTKNLVIVTVLMLALVLSGCAGAAYAQSSTPTAAPGADGPQQVYRTMSVNGSGKVYLTPDIAYITIGVHTENPSAQDAVAANNKQAQAVLDALKAAGIADRDLQTTNFSIVPQQSYDDQGRPTGEIRYLVDNQVYATVRDITAIGDVLDAAVKAGANTISGIQFDVADKTAALSNARQAAMNDAQKKAQELAGAAGVELGPVQTINEFTSGGPVPMYDMRAGMAAEAASVPVQSGQMLLTLEVSVVYEIR